MLDFFRFHFAFIGFTCRVHDKKIKIGFWYKDRFVEKDFADWMDAIEFTRKVTR